MEKRIAVLFAKGVEESEALTIVDILRRAGLDARITGVGGDVIEGAHGISVRADERIEDTRTEELDMVVIPGGYDGVDALMDSEDAIRLVGRMHELSKWTAAICAGPRVLDRAGVLKDKRYTCYPGQEKSIGWGNYQMELVVCDGSVITSIGPAACYAFAYALVDALGGDSLAVKNRMVYFNAFDEQAVYEEPASGDSSMPDRPARVAVLMKEGFEEGETFSIVDILRRIGAECTTYGFESSWVRGMHGMMLKADKAFPDDIEEYDAVVLPGGRPGGENLKNDPRVIDLLQRWNRMPGKTLSALCSGTTVLAAAQVIEGKHMTGYTGYAAKLPGAVFEEKLTVADQNLVTSQGPATGFPFAFRLAEVLGYDTSLVRNRLMYEFAGGKR